MDQTLALIDRLRSLLGELEEYIPKPSPNEGLDATFESLYQMGDIPTDERDMHAKLRKLGEEWRTYIEEEKNFQDFAENFNIDGFYPYYTKQFCRILFVGREACWLNSENYIETVCKSMQADDFNGWKVNQYPFHRRQFYIAYGILKFVKTGKFPPWNDVPWASDMAKTIFAKPCASSGIGNDVDELRSISWSFINLSKISNNTGDWQIGDMYHTFIADTTNREHIRTQVEILGPDIIVGSNVHELAEILGYAPPVRENANCYYYAPQGDIFPPFLNCWHFSAIKPDRTAYYDSVAEVVQKHCTALVHKGNISAPSTSDF